jgi:protein arginine kinase
MKDITEYIDSRAGGWLGQEEDRGIVLSSRVRLARNLSNASFPSWAGDEECSRVWQELCPVLTGLKGMPENLAVEMCALNELDRMILFERNLISRDHAEKGVGSGLVVGVDENLSIMVNEEDHLRLQGICAGLNLSAMLEKVSALDTEIEAQVRYAFCSRYGYLTACPSNVGTGMRASVMVHVPGLVLMEEINPIIKGLGKIGLAVRGLGGEGTEASGNMFQISNQITLGDSESSIVEKLNEIVLEIVEHEKNARTRLMQKKAEVVRDHAGRSYGILSGAHVLSSKEALDLLSGLRLGVDMGILMQVDPNVVDELLLQTRPGHLQKREGRELTARERDIARAGLIRNSLENNNLDRQPGRDKTDE